jgi:hypothetical protein
MLKFDIRAHILNGRIMNKVELYYIKNYDFHVKETNILQINMRVFVWISQIAY